LLDLLEAKNQDCILISHPSFIKILLNRFSARGYCITGRNTVRIAPLNRLLITKWDMHCGGCGHNCLLSNPGCGVGRDAARRRGIVVEWHRSNESVLTISLSTPALQKIHP
ncbi:MAG: hypothetical protein J1F18_07805, partial [Lachnospiraceae bacterium]|nr:hypothetical protein [Lachnospiraceae bacterium]